MNKRLYKTYEDLLRRKAYSAKELKVRLLKSLINNRHNELTHKVVYNKQLRYKLKWCSVSRHASRCFITGRPRGVIRFLAFSRHTLKRYALENKVQNIRTSSW